MIRITCLECRAEIISRVVECPECGYVWTPPDPPKTAARGRRPKQHSRHEETRSEIIRELGQCGSFHPLLPTVTGGFVRIWTPEAPVEGYIEGYNEYWHSSVFE